MAFFLDGPLGLSVYPRVVGPGHFMLDAVLAADPVEDVGAPAKRGSARYGMQHRERRPPPHAGTPPHSSCWPRPENAAWVNLLTRSIASQEHRLRVQPVLGGFGRPPKLTPEQIALGRRLVDEGTSVRDVAKMILKCHPALYRELGKFGPASNRADALAGK